jgi:hypothetical protein
MHHEWHVSVNRLHYPDNAPAVEHRAWMYEAMSAADAVRYLPLRFKAERLGQLPPIHQQCSQQSPEPVVDNHLTCCLGVECRKCPELLALDAAKVTDEQRDEIKAWTCVTHIVSKGGDVAREGYVLTTDDAMFWERTYAGMAAQPEDPVCDHCGKSFGDCACPGEGGVNP